MVPKASLTRQASSPRNRQQQEIFPNVSVPVEATGSHVLTHGSYGVQTFSALTTLTTTTVTMPRLCSGAVCDKPTTQSYLRVFSPMHRTHLR